MITHPYVHGDYNLCDLCLYSKAHPIHKTTGEETQVVKIQDAVFIEAKPEDITRRVKYVEDDEGKEVVEYKPDNMGRYPLTTPNVKSDLVCMHCAKPLIQKRNPVLWGNDLFVSHPLDADDPPYIQSGATAIIRDGWSAEEAIVEIGKMVRWVHQTRDAAKEAISFTPVQIDERRGKLFVLEAPKSPSYTEHHPNEHLTKVLMPLLTPHLEAIASALHITEALGPMQQWTFDMEDDCGFKGKLILQLEQAGDCTLAESEKTHDHTDVQRESGSDSQGGPDSNDTREGEVSNTGVHPIGEDRTRRSDNESVATPTVEGDTDMGCSPQLPAD